MVFAHRAARPASRGLSPRGGAEGAVRRHQRGPVRRMSVLREAIKSLLLKRGAVLSRPPGQFVVSDYKLRATAARGLQVRSAIDGGAADGEWTRGFKRIFPDAQVLMVEPRADAQPTLRQV